MDGLPKADKVFIGGSSGNLYEIIEKCDCKKVVVNAITLETLSLAQESFENEEPPTREDSKKISSSVDNLSSGKKKCLQLIRQIQESHQQGIGIAEILRWTGKDIGTVKKYREG